MSAYTEYASYKHAILFDVDGCLSNTSHRIHKLRFKPTFWQKLTGKIPEKDWEGFFQDMEHDPPNEGLLCILKAVIKDPHLQAVIITARPHRFRQLTIDWLKSVCGVKEEDYVLFMRGVKPNGKEDRRPDFLVKKDLLKQMKAQGLNPSFAFDDRDAIVDMYMRQKLEVAQVMNGEKSE